MSPRRNAGMIGGPSRSTLNVVSPAAAADVVTIGATPPLESICPVPSVNHVPSLNGICAGLTLAPYLYGSQRQISATLNLPRICETIASKSFTSCWTNSRGNVTDTSQTAALG